MRPRAGIRAGVLAGMHASGRRACIRLDARACVRADVRAVSDGRLDVLARAEAWVAWAGEFWRAWEACMFGHAGLYICLFRQTPGGRAGSGCDRSGHYIFRWSLRCGAGLGWLAQACRQAGGPAVSLLAEAVGWCGCGVQPAGGWIWAGRFERIRASGFERIWAAGSWWV